MGGVTDPIQRISDYRPHQVFFSMETDILLHGPVCLQSSEGLPFNPAAETTAKETRDLFYQWHLVQINVF